MENVLEWTDSCPVCKKSSLRYELKKGFFGLKSSEFYFCPNCDARFEKNKDKFSLISSSDHSIKIWLDYKNIPLSPNEWIRIANGGLSDEKQKEIDIEKFYSELRNGAMILDKGLICPVILKKNEEHVISLSNITLKEPRAVRKTSGGYAGPRIRIAKGVSIGLGKFGASSESHDEIRDIDRGTLTITTKRIIFFGTKSSTNIDLTKIISITPYTDGIGINRENKEKMQYFVGLPNSSFDIEVEGRSYKEPFSGVTLMSMIEGLISRINNPQSKNDGDTNGIIHSNHQNAAVSESFLVQVERNLKGKDLEKSGDIEGAIALYEQNIAEGFEGNHPYDRLAVIYRKRKEYSEEIRVLERAIFVFENYVSQQRSDVEPKLEKFKERLEKAKQLENKVN